LSKQLEPLVYNKTPRRHAATTFFFKFFFQLTPLTPTYGGFGGVNVNNTPKTIHRPRSDNYKPRYNNEKPSFLTTPMAVAYYANGCGLLRQWLWLTTFYS